jgi:hypothetical protein
MERRAFLNGMASTAIGLIATGCSRDAILSVRVAVDGEVAGRSIPTDFIGLSYESSILTPGNYFTPGNDFVLELIRSLGKSGIIRIGGNTSEQTVWRPERASAAQSGTFVITPAAIDRLAGALRIIGWQLIYGLNLARGEPEDAAAEAAYVADAVGPQLLAFQIGNEPDGFRYDFETFLRKWRLFQSAIISRVPSASFAGPDVATNTDWVAKFAAAKPRGLTLLTRHYYADGPAGASNITLANLVRSSQRVVPLLKSLRSISGKSGLPFRIVEANSIFNEGQPGVSDTLGAALWALELMFQIATADGAGINLHTGANNNHPAEDKAYTPIARTDGGHYRATPLYYGMLAFAIAGRGTLVPLQCVPNYPQLNAFATRADDGTFRFCLINKDSAHLGRVSISPVGRYTRASILRLVGPAAEATRGVTLGGTAVDVFGRWVPSSDETLSADREEIVVYLPTNSAAVVSLSPNEGTRAGFIRSLRQRATVSKCAHFRLAADSGLPF